MVKYLIFLFQIILAGSFLTACSGNHSTENVTKISSANAAGTFSGKFHLREGALSDTLKKEIEVTDGKFDVPMKK